MVTASICESLSSAIKFVIFALEKPFDIHHNALGGLRPRRSGIPQLR
jgi:hypothetical protein